MAFDAQHTANVIECEDLAAFLEGLEQPRFNMKRWHDVTPCGAVACMAGWIAERDGKAFFVETGLGPAPDEAAYAAYGAQKLGIGPAAAEALFRPPLYMADFAKISPWQAAAVLRRLAATGEVDWTAALET
jgi:hypothetical protein